MILFPVLLFLFFRVPCCCVPPTSLLSYVQTTVTTNLTSFLPNEPYCIPRVSLQCSNPKLLKYRLRTVWVIHSCQFPAVLDPCDMGCASLYGHDYSTCCVFVYLHFSSQIWVLEFRSWAPFTYVGNLCQLSCSSLDSFGKCISVIFCKKHLSWRKELMLLFLSEKL